MENDHNQQNMMLLMTAEDWLCDYDLGDKEMSRSKRLFLVGKWFDGTYWRSAQGPREDQHKLQLWLWG